MANYKAFANIPKAGSTVAKGSTSTSFDSNNAFPLQESPESKQSFFQKVGSFTKNLGSGVISPLVTAGVRTAQAAIAPVAIHDMNATTDAQNENIASLQSVLDRLKTETDPVKKQALSALAHQMVDQQAGDTKNSENAKALESKIDNPQTVLGVTVAPQQGGAKGVEQIAGQAATDAASIYGGEGLGEVGEGASLGSKVLRTAKTGAIAGAGIGAGNAAQDADTAGDVVKGGVEGALTGAATGAAAELGADTLSGAGKALKGKSALNAAVDLTRSAPDVDDQIAAAHQDSRLIAEGKEPVRTELDQGTFNKTKVGPSSRETTVAKAIQPLIEDGRINLDNGSNYVKNAAEVQKVINSEVARVRAGAGNIEPDAADLQKIFDTVPAPEKFAGPEQKAIVKNTQRSILDLAAKSDDLLSFQQDFGNKLKSVYGEDVFTNPRNPAQEYAVNLRNAVNDLIESKLPAGKLPEGDTFKSAQKNISNLISAKDGIIENGVKQNPVGTNSITRFGNRHPLLKTLGRRSLTSTATGALGIYAARSAITKAEKNAVKTLSGK